MRFIASFKQKHPDLFAYQEATEVYPHDQFVARSVLRFVPDQITPNSITLFRILFTPVVFLFVLYQHYIIGAVLFMLTAFTDVMDGSLARTTHKVTKFGMLFDPLADKLLIGSMVFLLVFQIDVMLALAVLGMEIALIMTALVAKAKFKTVRSANRWGKAKMLLQVVATCLTMIALIVDYPALMSVAAWLFGIAIGFAVLSLYRHGV